MFAPFLLNIQQFGQYGIKKVLKHTLSVCWIIEWETKIYMKLIIWAPHKIIWGPHPKFGNPCHRTKEKCEPRNSGQLDGILSKK